MENLYWKINNLQVTKKKSQQFSKAIYFFGTHLLIEYLLPVCFFLNSHLNGNMEKLPLGILT